MNNSINITVRTISNGVVATVQSYGDFNFDPSDVSEYVPPVETFYPDHQTAIRELLEAVA